MPGDLLAISDLHVAYPDNRRIVDELRPGHDDDWLIVAGDVGEMLADVEWALDTLARRFARVVWAPGNHELWTHTRDPDPRRGVERYEHLVAFCRGRGIVTPEDDYPRWTGRAGAVRIAPLFLLYDYSWLTPGTTTREESLAAARAAGIVCTDEYFLHPDPYESRAAWCHARVSATRHRLDEAAAGLLSGETFVLVNHWPLLREPTRVMTYQQFPQWCGTDLTADWHTRYPVTACVYGHLHIPRTTHYDGVRFEEVSIGYPREWRRYGLRDDLARVVLRG